MWRDAAASAHAISPICYVTLVYHTADHCDALSFTLCFPLSESRFEPEEMGLPTTWMLGTCFFALEQHDFASNSTLETLTDFPKSIGANTVAMQWMWNFNSTDSQVYSGSKTPSTHDLTRFIKTAHACRLHVVLKPIVVAPGSPCPCTVSCH